jgi:hypothetical protein
MIPANIALVFITDFDAPGVGLTPGHTALPRMQVSKSHMEHHAEAQRGLTRAIQIGDFGASRTEDELWAPVVAPGTTPIDQTNRRRQRWLRRHGGKFSYMLPVRHEITNC